MSVRLLSICLALSLIFTWMSPSVSLLGISNAKGIVSATDLSEQAQAQDASGDPITSTADEEDIDGQNEVVKSLDVLLTPLQIPFSWEETRFVSWADPDFSSTVLSTPERPPRS